MFRNLHLATDRATYRLKLLLPVSEYTSGVFGVPNEDHQNCTVPKSVSLLSRDGKPDLRSSRCKELVPFHSGKLRQYHRKSASECQQCCNADCSSRVRLLLSGHVPQEVNWACKVGQDHRDHDACLESNNARSVIQRDASLVDIRLLLQCLIVDLVRKRPRVTYHAYRVREEELAGMVNI